jgi:hypothetical protein
MYHILIALGESIPAKYFCTGADVRGVRRDSVIRNETKETMPAAMAGGMVTIALQRLAAGPPVGDGIAERNPSTGCV